MKRRLALTAGALVAALSFSSCSTFDHNDVAATVNGHELTRDQLDALVEDQLDALAATRATLDPAALDTTAKEIDIYREALTGWVQLVLLEGSNYQGAPADETIASARRQAAYESLSPEPSDGQWLYETGPARTGVACLSVIVTDERASADEASEALADGETFATVFSQYNVNASLEATGGILSTDGSDCASLEVISGLGVPVEELISLSVGESSAVLEIETVFAVVRIRDWSEVSPEWQQIFIDSALPDSVRQGDVSVASRFGTWDPVDMSVVAAAAG